MARADDVTLLLGKGRLPAVVQARLWCEIVASYVRVRWLVRGRPIREVVESLRGTPAGALSAEQGIRIGRRLAWPVRRTLDPLPWDSRCLMRSLVLLRMLARRGVETSLIIGVLRDKELSAHAWIELGDVPLLPTQAHEPVTRI